MRMSAVPSVHRPVPTPSSHPAGHSARQGLRKQPTFPGTSVFPPAPAPSGLSGGHSARQYTGMSLTILRQHPVSPALRRRGIAHGNTDVSLPKRASASTHSVQPSSGAKRAAQGTLERSFACPVSLRPSFLPGPFGKAAAETSLRSHPSLAFSDQTRAARRRNENAMDTRGPI